MAASEQAGTVVGLWRFPVKSMGGERLEQAELTEHGLVGDRGYALIDVQTGKVVSAKSLTLFPDVLSCQARFVEPPRAGQDVPPVRIVLPDGTSVTSDAGESQVTVAITDRGCGIAPALREQLFEPFFTTKAEGMGMGLNICRSIMEFHGGRVWAEPNPEGGTVFSFSIPMEAR